MYYLWSLSKFSGWSVTRVWGVWGSSFFILANNLWAYFSSSCVKIWCQCSKEGIRDMPSTVSFENEQVNVISSILCACIIFIQSCLTLTDCTAFCWFFALCRFSALSDSNGKSLQKFFADFQEQLVGKMMAQWVRDARIRTTRIPVCWFSSHPAWLHWKDIAVCGLLDLCTAT